MNVRDAIRVSIRIALVALLSYLAGSHSTGFFHGASADIGGLWSAISGILVLQTTRRTTWSSARLRILGTLIGSIVSAAYLLVLPFSASGMAGSVFAAVLLCHAVRIPDDARLAALTVAVIMVTASLNPALNPIANAALRLLESSIGTAIAVLAIQVWSGPEEPPNPPPQGIGDKATRP